MGGGEKEGEGWAKKRLKNTSPEPSCSQTILPHCKQLLTSLCFCPKHSHGCLPGRRTLVFASPSSL